MPRAGSRVVRLLVVTLTAMVVAGCGVFAQTPAPGSPSAAPDGLPSASIDRAAAGIRAQLAAALAARNLILADARVPFRPGEPAELAAVPRTVYQVQLRDDPTGGFIVVYELATTDLAATVGASLAVFLGSGPGRVQAPAGTVHVLRQVGTSVVYYRWLPGGIIDPDTPRIQTALDSLGVAVQVAR